MLNAGVFLVNGYKNCEDNFLIPGIITLLKNSEFYCHDILSVVDILMFTYLKIYQNLAKISTAFFPCFNYTVMIINYSGGSGNVCCILTPINSF